MDLRKVYIRDRPQIPKFHFLYEANLNELINFFSLKSSENLWFSKELSQLVNYDNSLGFRIISKGVEVK